MIKKIFSLLKGTLTRGGCPLKEEKAQKPERADTKKSQSPPYTEEEAQKVKERLQGLGYID